MPDPIKTPDALIKEFKKSGEFDRLRRELLSQFQNGDGTESFWARVDDIARARLDAEDKLHLKAADTLHRELLQELDRFPLVERAVADVPALSDPEFGAGIRGHAENLLRRSQGVAIPASGGGGGGGGGGGSNSGGVEEDGQRQQRPNSGARDHDAGASGGERRNGASLRGDGPQRDEGMEVSDG